MQIQTKTYMVDKMAWFLHFDLAWLVLLDWIWKVSSRRSQKCTNSGLKPQRSLWHHILKTRYIL